MKLLDQQLELNFDSERLPAGMETFTVRWLASWSNSSVSQWVKHIELGNLKCLNLGTGTSKKMYRVHRADLLHFLKQRHQ